MIGRLFKKVEKLGPICVGLDTDVSYIPGYIKNRNSKLSDILLDFNKTIINSTYDLVPAYKLQIAYYESYGIEGLIAYIETLKYIKSKGCITIGDIKRGDISTSAQKYAEAHFEGEFEADILTLNPYMGYETLDPFIKYLDKGKGIFVLLRTSNPGSKDIQYQTIEKSNKYLYYEVGDRLQEIGKKYRNNNVNYSNLGLVVGATSREDGKEIRERYKDMFFLIPGYGYQGGTGEDIKLYLNSGNGGIVNSSRGIMLNYKNYADGEDRFSFYTRDAVKKMKGDILGE